ncbi:CASP-like protein 1F1 [Musa acuminata AAA Group]|uniref:CASP-like protein 1F1 n=1 Tax=Musa acuminata AAA Group TaxID=214697 RepID=UPI0031CF12E0
MEMEAVKRSQEGAGRGRSRYIKLQVCSRVTAGLAALAAATLMGFNKQTSVVAGFAIEASYRFSPAFKFFVVGNAIACGYSVVSLPFVSNLVEGCTLNLFDLMNLGLVMAAAAAASAVGYVGKHGNDEIGWAKVCPYYERFCGRTEIALGCSYVAFLLFLFVCALFSVYKSRQVNSE